MDASILPLDVWKKIAAHHLAVWYSLIRVVRGLYDVRDRRRLKDRGCSSQSTRSKIVHYLDGKMHRDSQDGPAVIHADYSIYYTRGEMNRDPRKGPAYYSAECAKFYVKGQLHREEGPAVMMIDGSFQYYEDGRRHRDPEEGPAELTFGSLDEETGLKKIKVAKYYLNGALHRLDGPAVIHESGKLEYYKNGKRHRDDGPALIYPGGESEHYYIRGVRHRTDGPSATWKDGYVEYRVKGLLHRDPSEGPAVWWSKDRWEYYWRGELHRPIFEGPAYSNGKTVGYYEYNYRMA